MAFLAQENYDEAYYEPHVRRYLAQTTFTKHRLGNVFGLLGDVRGQTVLDVGCGMGTFTIEAALRGGRGIGVDPALPALGAATRLAAKMSAGAARFIAADAAVLPLPGSSVDAVVCADLTEHLDDATLDAVIADAARVLKPGGIFALYTPSPTHLFERLKDSGVLMEQDPSHIGLRGMPELRAAVERSGLEVVRAYHRPTHIPGYKWLETALAPLPGVGGLFRRRVCIAARKR
jgi:SAM-dependent methyltransferase